MGLPVPGIFVFRNAEKDEDLIIDGQQRLLTLKYFTEGMIRDKSFRLTEVADPWNGKLFKELDEQDQSLLEESKNNVTYFKKDSPKKKDRSINKIIRSEESNVGKESV